MVAACAAGLCAGRGGRQLGEAGRACAAPLCQLTDPRLPALPAAWRTLSSPGPEFPWDYTMLMRHLRIMWRNRWRNQRGATEEKKVRKY